MPVKSKAQERLMEGIKHGTIKPKKGQPSKAVAEEFLSHGIPKHLPEHVKKAKKAKKG